MEVIAVRSLVEFTFADIHNRRGKRVHSHSIPSIRQANCVERTGRVEPADVSYKTLFSECQFLPSHTEPERLSFRIPEFGIRGTEVHRVFERRAVRLRRVLSTDLRILALKLKF